MKTLRMVNCACRSSSTLLADYSALEVSVQRLKYIHTAVKLLNPKLEISPRTTLIDEKVKIKVTGLKPQQAITISASVEEGKDQFVSWGHFTTERSGELDLSQHESQGGTYTGLHQMGMFWSMQPAPWARLGRRLIKKDVTSPFIFKFAVLDSHIEVNHGLQKENILTSASIERRHLAEGVTRNVVREGRLRGVLFLPPGRGPFPGVIDMYGAAGGLFEHRAALLGSRGFASLALAVFRYEDLPDDLADVDLDYVEEAIDWLSGHSAVSGNSIGAVTSSKGGEFASMAACMTSKIKACVCINTYPYLSVVGHKYKGKYKPGVVRDFSKAEETTGGLNLKKCCVNMVPEAIIPHSNTQFLFIYGMNDEITDPNIGLSETSRIFRENKKTNLEVALYPGAGHLIEPPYLPVCTVAYHPLPDALVVFGGEKTAHAEAQARHWGRIMQFLNKHLVS